MTLLVSLSNPRVIKGLSLAAQAAHLKWCSREESCVPGWGTSLRFTEDANSPYQCVTPHQPCKDLQWPGLSEFLRFRADDPGLGVSCYMRRGEKTQALCLNCSADTVKHMNENLDFYRISFFPVYWFMCKSGFCT